MSMQDALRKMCLMPARTLDGFVPQMKKKGRMQVGMDADIVVFIYRDEYYNQETTNEKGLAELIIAKQRNGPTGQIDLVFQHEYTRFENADFSYDEADAPW